MKLSSNSTLKRSGSNPVGSPQESLVDVSTVPHGVDDVKSIRRPLDSRYWDLLVDGMGSSWHTSRSEAVRSFTLHAVNRGWDWSEFWHHMSQPDQYRLAEVYHRRGARSGHRSRTNPVKAAQADWDRAVAKVAKSPAISDKAGARQELALIVEHFGHVKMLQSDRYVLTFVHKEAQRRGRIVLSVSVRSISLGSGVPVRTVLRSLKRLVETGWISRHSSRNHVRDAQTYRLLSPGSQQCHSCGATRSQGESQNGTTVPVRSTGRSTGRANCGAKVRLSPVSLEEATSDALLVLGRHRATVYSVFLDGPRTARQVIEATGMSKATVHRHLKHLADSGLLSSDKGLWDRTSKTLDELAVEMGVQGAQEARQERVEQDRAGWDQIADKAQYKADRARYGARDAAKRAIAFQKARIVVDLTTGEIKEIR